ncbi:MAG: 23S rRNA (pseudouridine(1915)-N(3))-methyltransferase RlmH [Myxococcota bacterium]
MRIISVGALKPPAYRVLVDEYLGRLRHFCSVEEVELRDGPRLATQLDKASKDAVRVALEVEGKTWTSRALATQLEGWASRGKGIVSFAIGAADGLPQSYRRDVEWSLSRLTLPHRMAKLVVAEQLYRAMTILRHVPYDH